MSSFLQTVLANVVDEGIARVQGRDYPYYVVRRELEPRLPNFVGVIDGTLFISEETPPEFREYVIAHEVYCTVILADQPGRCRAAVEREMAMVPDDQRVAYVAFRVAFFIALIEYSQASGDADFLQEIQASLDYLRSLRPGS